jgi:trehalose 6-phosphate phosphatase
MRVPRSLLRVGAHGLEAAAADEAPAAFAPPSPPRLLSSLAKIAEAHDGVWLEAKGPVVAIHYRKAPHAGRAIYEEVKSAIAAEPGYSAQIGKMVVEAKPASANKGRALAAAMQAPPFSGRMPAMVGDDTTDEDAFKVARDLGGVAVKVGPGDTRADFRLRDPDAVTDWLRRSVG